MTHTDHTRLAAALIAALTTSNLDRLIETISDALALAEEHVSTVDELDALPMGSAILDPTGKVWVTAWRSSGKNTWGHPILTSQALIDHLLAESVDPDFTVIHRPPLPTRKAELEIAEMNGGKR